MLSTILNKDFIDNARRIEADQLGELKAFFDFVLQQDPDNFSALYGNVVLGIRFHDIPMAVGNYREISQRIIMYQDILEGFFQDFENYEQLLEIARAYIHAYPDDPFGYMLKLSACYSDGDFDAVRQILKDYYAVGHRGIHFQPSTIASVFDAEQGQAGLSMSPLSLARDVRAALFEMSRKPAQSAATATGPAQTAQGSSAAMKVTTLPGEADRRTGAVLNGKIEGADRPTQYFFRYGASPDRLTAQTEKRPLPPGRNARVVDTGSNLFRRITSFSLTTGFVGSEENDSRSDPVMRLEGPFGKDRNHREGIGVIDLVLNWMSAVHVRGDAPDAYRSDTYPVPVYPGEAVDLRDAEFTVTCRGNGLDAKKYHLVAWLHGANGEALLPDVAENCAAWAHTASLGKDVSFLDDHWRQVRFNLAADSRDWSFCGNNVEETNPTMARYCYHPIGEVLRENHGGNICLCFVCGDEMVPPEGGIDIGALALEYRSHSLLSPGQGAELVSGPDDGLTDPRHLSGGWIGDFDHFWQSAKNPSGYQTFIWEFREDAEIQSVRLHQHPLWPARDVMLAISDDGEAFEIIWNGRLQDVAADPAAWPQAEHDGTPFNLAGSVVFDTPVRARYLRLTVASGYRTEFWGLDAIEVFGTAPAFIPSPEPFTTCEHVGDLPPGPVYAQLVAEQHGEITEGPVVEISRPDSSAPCVENPVVIRRSATAALVKCRTNAMGSWSMLSGTLKGPGGKHIEAGPVGIGREETARDSVLCFEGIESDVRYDGVAQAANEHGSSTVCTFVIQAHGSGD